MLGNRVSGRHISHVGEWAEAKRSGRLALGGS